MKRFLLMLLIPTLMVTAFLLLPVTKDSAYAKGVVRSESSRSNRDDDNASQRSSRGSSSKEEKKTTASDSSSSRSENRSSDSSRTTERSEPERNTSSRNETRSDRDTRTDSNRGSNGQSDRGSSSGPTYRLPDIRSESPGNVRGAQPPPVFGGEHRSDSRLEGNRGNIRREYEDIGRIAEQRLEKRKQVTVTRNPRYRDDRDRYDYRDYFHFVPRYNYYDYYYTPGRVFPAPYCFYYGYFPPYIYGTRVFYSYRPFGPYVYIDLPDIIFRSYDYYDYRYTGDRYRDLSDALRDIRRGWEAGETHLITRHMRRNSQIDVFMWGDYAYSLDWNDFRDMTLDAIQAIDTVDFRFYRVRQRGDREVVAYAEHSYYDDFDDGGRYYPYKSFKRTVYVSYTLRRYDDDWFITEVSYSPNKYY